MDIFRRQRFNEAMFAKNRTLAIRIGRYQSSDIKEAHFDYGYIKGDTYKPGGTCAGSGKITFTSIITTFNKLDKIYPEIGLLVDRTYEWVKMGEYFINDIEIDRNRKTTKLDLMDGMFKLNREHVTDLTYPAEIRHVIKEICLKTGIELANEYMDITSMNYRIEQIPKNKKMTFRDILSLATQMLGMSCFFNREGKLEIKKLTDSGITISADSYFMHGLTKSEIEYQIAGISCKKDKEILTVGMRTGRSLELDNLFMSQTVLDNLYHNIKDIRYYPFNLNYQGHLLLNVGEWVTIKTNTGETFKSPVLSQSFTFKGGLRGRISADSKAGNDAQYSYAGTITKKIEQFNEFEAQIQNQIEEADKGFDQKVSKLKKDFNDQFELTKARAEEVKRQISSEIDKKFQSFDNASIQEAKRKAEEALRNSGASSLLAQEAKRIGLDSVAKLEEFKRQATSAQTALSGDLDALKRTIANDIRPKQAQAEAEIAKQVEALVQTKKELAGIKSAQATYEETTTRRLAELSNLANGKASKSELTQTSEQLASKIASVLIAHRNQEDRVSAVESNFKQRADSLEAGVSRLTEGLRTKADISSLNVTAENIRQSVKSLETDTQNKLDQKLSQAEFEVQAGSIRQEILNATKDKADKTLVVAEAGKLREEFSNLRVGGKNYYRDSEKIRTSTRFFPFPLHPYLTQENVGETWTLSFDLKINEGGEIRPLHFYHYQMNRFGLKTSADITPSREWQRFTFTGPLVFPNDDSRYSRGEMALYDYAGNNNYSVRRIKLEKGTLATDWSPAPEDTDGLITEAKATFERTAQGLRTDLSAIQEYVNKDGQRQEALQRYSREESAKQATAVRELVTKDYVGKSTYQETVRAIENKFEAITNPQNGSIATQIANYKTAVDGRFADISSLLSGKASQSDFQRVKETSQLYERILGNTENGIADKVARMAMTNQLFQVEVGKAFAEHQNLFLNSTLTKGFLGNNGIINIANATQKEVTSDFISVDPNEKIIFQHWVTLPENGMAWTAWQFFDKNKNPIDNRKPGLNAYKTTVGKQHNINQITIPANAYFVRFSARMYDDGLIKVEKGSAPSDYSVAPNDALEAVKTVQRQLDGSWSVQNINSAGDIISGINLGANGHNRFDGKLTHITGETLIDKAVIKSAMIDKLKTANFEAGSVTTIVLDAEAVTAEKIKVDQALFNKLVANEAYLSQLFAKQAFINRVQSVAIDASQVRSGILSGDRIYGGTIRGTNIYGGTLTGHTQIQLGSYGSFNTVNGGLQINVPRDYNAKDGLSVQFIGSYGRGENVPYGLFLYRDSDFTIGNTATDTDEFIMTVEGYIKAKGIGWLKTGLGKVGSVSTGTLAFWKSTVALDFAPNDIYYTYGGQAYGLWAIIKQNFSDRRLKDNIVDCKHKALDYIYQFQFKEYDWKKQEDRQKQAHTKIGLIAQEVQAVDPTLVYENGDTLNLDNLRLTNIALKAIQELALENQKLTHRLENLENEYRTA